MKGRTEENIKKSMGKMHKIAEIIFDEELEPIDSYLHDVPDTKNSGLWKLGRSLQMLADADFFIGMEGYSEFNHGCMIEREAARRYGIRGTLVNAHEIMPDLRDVEARYYAAMEGKSEVCSR